MTGRLREFNTPGPSGGVRGRAKNCLKNKSQRISSLTCFCYSDAPISLTWRAAASLFAQVVAFLFTILSCSERSIGATEHGGITGLQRYILRERPADKIHLRVCPENVFK